jgi:L-lactate dehydrogenase complex protein LldG
MSSQSAKQNILKKIRQALNQPVPLPFPEAENNLDVFKQQEDDPAVIFAQQFSALQGKFAVCNDDRDMIIQLQQLLLDKGWNKIYCKEDRLLRFVQETGLALHSDLSSCDVSITGCEYLVARTGTIVLSSAQQSGRTTSIYAPVHICIAYNHQLVYDLKNAIENIRNHYKDNLPSLISFASGPSRTADIEKTLVTGVHGPKEVYCFLIDG